MSSPLSSLPAWLRNSKYQYVNPTDIPGKAAQTERDLRGATPIGTTPIAVQGETLATQGRGAQKDILDSRGQVITQDLRTLKEKEGILGHAYGEKSDTDSQRYKTDSATYRDNFNQMADSQFGRSLILSDRIRDQRAGINTAMAGAVSGEQALDGRKIDLLEKMHFQRPLTQQIGDLVGSLAPIAALFLG